MLYYHGRRTRLPADQIRSIQTKSDKFYVLTLRLELYPVDVWWEIKPVCVRITESYSDF